MTPERPPRLRLEDVAAAAGVSRATASRVVNGGRRVSPAARAAVEGAIAQLGYVPNRAARSLAADRTDTIALVVREPGDRLFSDPFLGRAVRGVAAALAGSPYQLVLVLGDGGDDGRGDPRLTGVHADGVLVLSMRADDPLPGYLAERGTPCVVAGRPVDGLDVGRVDVDNVDGAATAVRHLVATGRRTIATIAGPQDMAPGADRLAGWEKALGDAGLASDASLVAEGDFTQAGGAAAAARLLARRPDVDAVFAASDLMGIGAIDTLEAAGRRVPADVAVVGFDDGDLAETSDPPLTTVRQPIDELGREMVRLVLAQLAGDPPTRAVLPTQLVVRASS